MRAVVDTNVAIYLRDAHPIILTAVANLPAAPMLSVLSRVELEGGIYRKEAEADLLRRRLDALLEMMDELPFTSAEAAMYGRIVRRCGYSRPRVIDRMIAATAMVADATLITLNAGDFRDIEGLRLESWENPAG